MPEGDAEEEVTVQQTAPGRATGASSKPLQGGGIEPKQLLPVQELLQAQHPFPVQVQPGLGAHLGYQRIGADLATPHPAAQQLELGPADAEVALTHRVMEGPGGGTLGGGGAGMEAQLLSEWRQR